MSKHTLIYFHENFWLCALLYQTYTNIFSWKHFDFVHCYTLYTLPFTISCYSEYLALTALSVTDFRDRAKQSKFSTLALLLYATKFFCFNFSVWGHMTLKKWDSYRKKRRKFKPIIAGLLYAKQRSLDPEHINLP